MGVLSWFQSLASGKDASYDEHKATHGLTEAVDEEATKYGLNFIQVIEAHQRWKKRLGDYVDDRSTEKLNADDVCCDDKCVLGIWIYSSGKDAFGAHPLYEDMRHTHAQFHSVAGEVVKLKQGGDANSAKSMLNSGLFTQLSGKLQTKLAKLYVGETIN
jgi:methyl-accepting chemotaxis protein